MAASRVKEALAQKLPWKKRVLPHSSDPEHTPGESNRSDVNPTEFVSMENSEDEPREARFVQQRVVNMFKGFFRVSSGSKLALKLYGSQKALKEEQNRQMRSKSWVIHPLSSFRRYWDLMMLLLLLFTVTALPISIAFYENMNPGWLAVNIITDTLFILDIIVNFRTGILTSEHSQQVELAPKKIAIRYLKGWFIVDVISSIPFDYFTMITSAPEESGVSPSLLKASRAFRIVRLTKLLSLLRLLRLSRFLRYLQRWEDEFPSLTRIFNVASGILRISKLILLMLLLAHWNGCIQFLVPVLQDIPDNSWIAINRLENADVFEQYSWSLFKAISHMLCIGFGRWPPQNTTEVWLTIISMTIGAMFYALYIGNMSDLILSIDYSGRIYNEKLNQVEEYMRYRKLPQDLRQKVFDFYEHRYQRKYFDEDSILESLSPGLREDIIAFNCQKLVKSVPFFENAHPEFVSDVVTKLKFEVFLKGEFIIKAGTVGTRMYFIQSGVVDVLTEEGELMTKLTDGSHFGEICLLTSDRRVASVKAVTTIDLFSLSKEHFTNILQEYPEMKQTLETVAVERLNMIGMPPPPQLSAEFSPLSDHPLHGPIGEAADQFEVKPTVSPKKKVTFEDSDPPYRRWSEPTHRGSGFVEQSPHHRKLSLLTTGKRMTVEADTHGRPLVKDGERRHRAYSDADKDPHNIPRQTLRKSEAVTLPPLAEDCLLQRDVPP